MSHVLPNLAGNQRLRALAAIFLIYFMFAILLNSVGTVIMQVIHHYGVSKPEASILEGYKDIPISVMSFLLASFLPRLGYKKAMQAGLTLVSLACIVMPLLPGFAATKALFFCTGVAFALVKVSVYSTVGVLTADARQHASVLNILEGFFMVGVLSGSWIFACFIDASSPDGQGWLNVYWLLAALCGLTLLLVSSADFDTPVPEKNSSLRDDFMSMLKLMMRPLVLIYIVSAFLYVLIEQGIGSWLPTFNREILHMPAAMSVQAASIYAGSLAVGRLSAGLVLRRMGWYPLVNICVIGMGLLVVLSLPLTSGVTEITGMSWRNAPLAAFVFPLIGLFMAPVYPAINSVMLSSLPKHLHAAMTGLLVVFSALGGTTGSMITGYVFGHFDGRLAFYLSLVPLTIILLSLFLFRRSLGAAASQPLQVKAGAAH